MLGIVVHNGTTASVKLLLSALAPSDGAQTGNNESVSQHWGFRCSSVAALAMDALT